MNAEQRQCADAADWLEDHELVKGHYWADEMGNQVEEERELVEMACLIGCLMIVEDRDPDYSAGTTEEACNLVYMHLEQWEGQDMDYVYDGSLIRYSDHPERSREDVIRALRGGAKLPPVEEVK